MEILKEQNLEMEYSTCQRLKFNNETGLSGTF
jgi:hypothetical protein